MQMCLEGSNCDTSQRSQASSHRSTLSMQRQPGGIFLLQFFTSQHFHGLFCPLPPVALAAVTISSARPAMCISVSFCQQLVDLI
jgi:hypothetical protein